jgi:hypothetical protein
VDPAVVLGLLREPGAEDRANGQGQLELRILGKRLPGLLVEALVGRDEPAQRRRRQLGVGRGPHAHLGPVEQVVEETAVDPEDDVAEHREEAAVAVPGEAIVPGPLGQPLDRLVVQAEVQDRFHHARHGDPGAGADGDEERAVGVAEPEADEALEAPEMPLHLLPQALGVAPAQADVLGPRLGRDREPGRDPDSQIGHLGQLASLAAEQIPELARAFGPTPSEEIDKLPHRLGSPPRPAEKSFQRIS